MVVLVLAQVTHAVTFAAQHAACIALVSRYFPGRLRGRGQALYTTLGYGVSGVVGGVAGGALIERWGFPAVFWAASVAALLSRCACCARAAMRRSPRRRLEGSTQRMPADPAVRRTALAVRRNAAQRPPLGLHSRSSQ